MNTFERHISASTGRRFGAAFVNLMCAGLVATICKNIIENEVTHSIVAFSIWTLLAIAACLLPESMGKRFCNMQVLGENKEKIETKIRLIRTTPYFVLCISWIGFSATENPILRAVFGTLNLLSFLFLFASGLSILFSPSNLSLLDMKLKTRVMTPPPLRESLKPTFFGLKIR
jgi:small-conductance mechanosensitive channel